MAASPSLHVLRHSGPPPELAPSTDRARLIVELRDGKPLDEQVVRAYLRQLGDLCDLRAVNEPAVLRLEDGSFSGWLHGAHGGAQLLSWGEPSSLVSLDLVARHVIDPEQVVRFSALFFEAREAVATDPRRPGEHWQLTAEAVELRQLCDWAIAESRSGRDLARAVTLVIGAGLEQELAEPLLARIGRGIADLYASHDPKLALTHGEGIGEALMLLRHAGVDTSTVAPWGGQPEAEGDGDRPGAGLPEQPAATIGGAARRR